jgi:mRNA interferase MazF
VTPVPRRGEVWLATLDKVRPVVVLTRDPLGRYLHAVIAAPVTSRAKGVSTEVSIGRPDGLRVPSVASLDNVQLVNRDNLERRVGRARPETMRRICAALAIAVDCDGGSAAPGAG